MRARRRHAILFFLGCIFEAALAQIVTEVTFVYQGKTDSFPQTIAETAAAAVTTPAVPVVAQTSAAVVDVTSAASAAVAVSSITPALAATETIVPVSILSTTVPVSIATVPAPAPATTILTLTSSPDGPVGTNTGVNGYASAQSAASAAAASAASLASANGESAVGGQSSGGSGGLSKTLIIGLAAGLGGLGLLLLIGIILCCVFMRRRKDKKREASYYVYTAEEEAKDDARRSQMSSRRQSPIGGNTPSGVFSKQNVQERSLPKVSEEPYAVDDHASAAGAGLAGAGPYSAYDHRQPLIGQGYNEQPATRATGPGAYFNYNGGRSSPLSRTTVPDNSYSRDAAALGAPAAGLAAARATSPAAGPNNFRPAQSVSELPAGGSSNVFAGRGPARYEQVPNGPTAGQSLRAPMSNSPRSSTGNPPRASLGVSPAAIRGMSPGGVRSVSPGQSGYPARLSSNGGYNQPAQDQPPRLSVAPQDTMSGFDFGLGHQSRGQSPDNRAQQGRYSGQSQPPGNY